MNWFEIIGLICIAIYFVWMVLSLGAISNGDRRCDLADAILVYHITCFGSKNFNKAYSVELDDIRGFYGIWDYLPWNWSYKRLLPPDKYEIIKPYLEVVKGKRK